MKNISQILGRTVQLKLAFSIAIIILNWFLKKIFVKIVNHRISDVQVRYGWRKALSYTAIALDVLIIGVIWMNGMKSFATYFGLLSAGVSIALKDPILNLAAWVFIMTQRPFKIGDRIEVQGHIGDVIDIGIFQFLMIEVGNWVDADQSTGRIIHVPNELTLTTSVINYTKGFPYIWNEIGVLVTFESDWRKAKEILEDIVNKHAES